jgi:peptide-methionine (S)-S-oxide reductase
MTNPIMKQLALVVLALAASGATLADEAKATFAGGCFWCMEPPYDKLDGVKNTLAGYSGGDISEPSYEQVASGRTGHAEVVQVTYDPERIDYRKLLAVYWRNIDPVDGGGQFCDRGSPYRPVIFYHNERQKRLAEQTRRELAESDRLDKPIAVTVEPLEAFYRAEDYHQSYYRKNSMRYNYYRNRCGRDARLEAIWGDQAGGKGTS